LTLENGESVLSLSRHNKFLVCTTTKHELIIWKAEDLEKDAKNGIGVRRGCERGANIVMSYDTKVVLQMPRGNIETIEPRMLLLAKVCKCSIFIQLNTFFLQTFNCRFAMFGWKPRRFFYFKTCV
jgi:hypothetical protein